MKTTTAHLQRVLSAQEFQRWIVWMDQEQIGPDWDALRHAQMMAAIHNGPMKKRGDGFFQPSDFMRHDPWHADPPPEPDPASDLFERLDVFYSE